MAEILKLDPKRLEHILDVATRLVLSGKVVAVPTDTLYGLAADPFNLAAVSEISRIKRRTVDKPLPLLVDSIDQAAEISQNVPSLFYRLAEKYWPGPLTIVVSAAPRLPLKVTGNTGKVGLRWPKAPIVVALIAAAGRPLIGPSANLPEYPPCTPAEDVLLQIGDAMPLIIDGGPTPDHVPSTVIELFGERARIIRPGAIPASELKEILG